MGSTRLKLRRCIRNMVRLFGLCDLALFVHLGCQHTDNVVLQAQLSASVLTNYMSAMRLSMKSFTIAQVAGISTTGLLMLSQSLMPSLRPPTTTCTVYAEARRTHSSPKPRLWRGNQSLPGLPTSFANELLSFLMARALSTWVLR